MARFVFAGGRSDQRAVALLDWAAKLAAGVALVGDRSTRRRAVRSAAGRSATSRSSVGEARIAARWGAVRGDEQVQAHAPEAPGMLRAVAVAAGVGQLGAADRLDRSTALDRGRVEQHQVVVEAGTLAANTPISHSIVSRQSRPALAVPGLLGQLGEQVREALAGDREELDDLTGSP